MTPCYRTIDCPLGRLHMVTDDQFLLALAYDSNWERVKKSFPVLRADDSPVAGKAERQLEEYFRGTRRHFDISCAPRGTDFQRRVWGALLTIPFGRTSNYKAQAEALNHPTATRAVGHANGQNPISIIIPCHRVIGTSGNLTGYAGGLEAKKFLIHHELELSGSEK